MLDPQILDQHKETILKIASANHINEVKVFGKHIGQQFELQAGINFIIIPQPMMDRIHQRNFEQTVASLLNTTVEVFTPKDLQELAKDAIITTDEAKNYLEKSINLNAFGNGDVKENAKLSDEENIPVSSAELLSYLEEKPRIWNAISQKPALLSEALEKLTQKALLMKQ